MRLATHRIPGGLLTEHEFEVPLDHAQPDGEKISVFAREVVAPGKEDADIPWLVFLQGGPGSTAPRWTGGGWIARALQDYRVVLLDQRGTGRSTLVDHVTLARRAGDAQAQADYLFHHRADSIVRDCELVRRELTGGRPWTVLGQSFGGFCTVSYLSLAPEGMEAALITGGLPPLDGGPDAVYRLTYRRVADRNRRYYERYPDDVERVRELVVKLDRDDLRLPGGDRLTSRRFRQIGMRFGARDGFETVHYLVDTAFQDRELPFAFLNGVEQQTMFETHPIYALLHEAEYVAGEASRWSAHRVIAEFPEFERDDPVLFTGEMIYPWVFEDYGRLRPLRDAANLLAERDDWPPLYDRDRLARNDVPVAAAVYYDDMYVERTLSEETARTIRGARTWVTSAHEHDALRMSGEEVLGRLIGMIRGEL